MRATIRRSAGGVKALAPPVAVRTPDVLPCRQMLRQMPRLIDLEGCLNFRDLGGYPAADGRSVRWRRVFRSDALHLLTPRDVARIRDELGVRDVIDLRSSAELRSEGQGPLAEHEVRFHHVPLFDAEVRSEDRDRVAQITLADRYVFLAELAGERIARVVHLVADADTPAVYHCAAGKDRTGVISALLLGLLGVPDEVIVADYVATRENLDAIVDRLRSLEGYRAMLDALPPDTMHADPETMLEFLARLRDRYGTIEDYARHAGLPADAIDRLRDRLLVAA
jgi:protein-tyrosine phosphatase